MTSKSRWSLTGFSLFLIVYIAWRHFFDLFQWKLELSLDPIVIQRRNYQEYIEVLEVESNCGIRETCPDDSFPVFMSTGKNKKYLPKLCVSGKYVIASDLNGGGRGLNAAVVEPTHFDVVSVRNFDTYRYDKSDEIKTWLNGLLNNDILIIFTSDEASVNLSGTVKTMLNDLGSGKIQDLQYRSQWYMITQKGTKGFTMYEKITFGKNKNWGDLIEFRNCVPRKIPKQFTTSDESLRENRKRSQFCAGLREDRFQGFCHGARFEIILPALLTNRSLIGNPVYSTPVFLFASNNTEILISSLDSLIHQPGVYLPVITVFYEEGNIDVPGLTQIYGVQNCKIKYPRTFQEKVALSRKTCRKLHANQKYLMVIDENIILSPDFLFYMAQTMKSLEKDDTILSISAWSSNCYGHDGDVHLAYRIRTFPKFAVLVPLKTIDDNLFGDTIVPDVSRLQGPDACHLPSLQAENWIERPQDLTKDRYFHKLVMLQQLSQDVDLHEMLNKCSTAVFKSKINVIYFQYDDEILSKLLKCLGVIRHQYGIYEGIIRLSVEGKMVLLISNESTFYKARPIASL